MDTQQEDEEASILEILFVIAMTLVPFAIAAINTGFAVKLYTLLDSKNHKKFKKMNVYTVISLCGFCAIFCIWLISVQFETVRDIVMSIEALDKYVYGVGFIYVVITGVLIVILAFRKFVWNEQLLLVWLILAGIACFPTAGFFLYTIYDQFISTEKK